MGCLTQVQLAARSMGSSEVVGMPAVVAVAVAVAVAAVAAAVEGTTVVVVVGVAILLAVGRVGAEPVVVPATLAVDATILPAAEPIAPA